MSANFGEVWKLESISRFGKKIWQNISKVANTDYAAVCTSLFHVLEEENWQDCDDKEERVITKSSTNIVTQWNMNE